jgi:RNA polymerase sigma-70 factor (ECF subfamily)
VTGEQIIDEGTDFEQHRRYLSAVAYRLLGSLADAEDAVQDAWLRWQSTDRSKILEPRAYLTTVVTRICYDQLGSARARREAYFGEWLPEPSISTVERQPGPEDAASLGESVSYAMLAVMEQLTPAERVAFVLHDVFAVGFGEIAEALGRTPESVRQLASRARRRVREGTSGTSVAWAESEAWPQSAEAEAAAEADSAASAAEGDSAATSASAAGSRLGHPWRRLDRPEHRKVVAAFAAASLNGDISGLMAVLDPDVVWHSDGGGIVKAGAQPVRTADRVARLVSGLTRWLDPESGLQMHETLVNGAPGLVIIDKTGAAMGVMAFVIVDDRIVEAYAVVNPEKLGRVAGGAVSAYLPRREAAGSRGGEQGQTSAGE